MDHSLLIDTFENACRTTLDSPGSADAESARNLVTNEISGRITSLYRDVAWDSSALKERQHQLHALLQFLEELFSTPLPAAAEVLELVIMDLLPDILSCESVNKQLLEDVRRLMSRMASTCHPRDTLTTFLAQINSSCPRRCHCQALLEAIPAALSRLKRQQLDMLCSVLQEAHAHFVACLDEDIGSDHDHILKTEAIESLLRSALPPSLLDAINLTGSSVKVLGQLITFHRALPQSLSKWPPAVQIKAHACIAARLLEFAGKIALDFRRLPISLPQLHPAAQRHFVQGDETSNCIGLAVARVVDKELQMVGLQSSEDLLNVSYPVEIHKHLELESAHEFLKVGKATMLFCLLCCPKLDSQMTIVETHDLLKSVSELLPLLLQRASDSQSIGAVQKAMALVIASAFTATKGYKRRLCKLESYQKELMSSVAITANENPEQILRNAATQALTAILNCFQVEARMLAVEFIHRFDAPGVSAQAIQFLTKTFVESWVSTSSSGTSDDLHVLRSNFATAALDWIDRTGRHSPKDGSDLVEKGEAVCAALNLYRSVLLKDFSSSKTHVEAKDKRELRAEYICNSLLPLQKLTEQTLAVYSDEPSLLQETLGLQRILEVLSRIMQITEDKSSS